MNKIPRWQEKETGHLVISMQDAHTLLATRDFEYEGRAIFEVAIEATPEEQLLIDAGKIPNFQDNFNNMLDVINQIDCDFHESFEVLCNGAEYG